MYDRYRYYGILHGYSDTRIQIFNNYVFLIGIFIFFRPKYHLNKLSVNSDNNSTYIYLPHYVRTSIHYLICNVCGS